MQVYDEANVLAKQIRESEVCVSYRQMKEEIAQDATSKALIDEYKKLQMQLQMAVQKRPTARCSVFSRSAAF